MARVALVAALGLAVMATCGGTPTLVERIAAMPPEARTWAYAVLAQRAAAVAEAQQPAMLLEMSDAPPAAADGGSGRRGDADDDVRQRRSRESQGVLAPAGLRGLQSEAAPAVAAAAAPPAAAAPVAVPVPPLPLPAAAPPLPRHRLADAGLAAEAGVPRRMACRCDAFECRCDQACACALLGDGGVPLATNSTVLPAPVREPATAGTLDFTFRCDCGFAVEEGTTAFDSLSCACATGGCSCRRACVCD